ncbi:unnamed protein product [Didymodactylos carnosus]|uniref:Protein kinase domain-containing protein n=1 Tax=Didymodactylos carnosus TaxID=1234261 RepID=A0A813YJZ8_9BILA|nr:unnamed protein product [Didymodactylos carnosus]CAF0885676.1 unnamed protein product [Didymodactylos carnosus]CAF3517174.1 unnamed protein product [Didymodactylos carnosus]CAF3670970.1 unnamed protein product [Didymodactylos carnosus]
MFQKHFHWFDDTELHDQQNSIYTKIKNYSKKLVNTHQENIQYVESNIYFNQQFTEKRQPRLLVQCQRFCLQSISASTNDRFKDYLIEREDKIRDFLYHINTKLNVHNLTLDNFKLVRELGRGGYGSVLLAFYPDTNEFHALKAVKKSSLVETDEQRTIIHERQYAFALRHPNIVELITSFKDNEYVYLVLEWLPGGDLYSLMTSQKLTELQALFYVGQLVMALDYLHQCKVVFRDLKPENIVLTKRGYCKLVDLGLAKIIRGYSETFCGTPHYIAPEVILHKPYTSSPDWWALGVILHEMVTGEAPYDRSYHENTTSYVSQDEDDENHENSSKDAKDVNKLDQETSHAYFGRSKSTNEPSSEDNIRQSYLRIINGCAKFNFKNVSNNCADLIKNLLKFNVNQRLGCGEKGALDVMEHVWFEHLDFWKLYNQDIQQIHARPSYEFNDLEDTIDDSESTTSELTKRAQRLPWLLKRRVCDYRLQMRPLPLDASELCSYGGTGFEYSIPKHG